MATNRGYRHTQTGLVIVVTMGLAALAVIVAVATAALPPPFLALAGVFLVCLVLFGSLTVDVDDAAVSIRFGPGLIRRSFALAEIRAVTAVRNPWYYGWGIRLLPRGWLYNVSGLDAVEIELADGRTHRIGTDEPEALAAAIQQARGAAG
jgi:hypothetical protein